MIPAAELARCKDFETRVDQFHALELPGQPIGMHMGTMYLISDLWKAYRALIDALEKAQGENDMLVSVMADLAERATAAIAKATAQRNAANALLRGVLAWDQREPLYGSDLIERIADHLAQSQAPTQLEDNGEVR
jgi:hypothetical protein